MRLRAFTLTLALVLTAGIAAWAQDDGISPAPNAMIVGSTPTVTFRWRGDAPAYQFDLYATNQRVQSTTVSKSMITLPLAPGPSYRWSVRALSGGRFTEIVPFRGFQLSTNLTLSFDGGPGRPGETINLQTPQQGANGGPGGPGQPGMSVGVQVEPAPGLAAADMVRVVVQGNTRQTFYLLKSSAPLLITANGGAGGVGGAGADGMQGLLQPQYDASGRIIGWYQTLPTPGGDGGPGGRGGDGGTVTIQSSVPADAARLVTVRADAGRGGQGGRGGRGGAAPSPYYSSGYSVGTYPPPIMNPAPPGRDGTQGQDGTPGRVMR